MVEWIDKIVAANSSMYRRWKDQEVGSVQHHSVSIRLHFMRMETSTGRLPIVLGVQWCISTRLGRMGRSKKLGWLHKWIQDHSMLSTAAM